MTRPAILGRVISKRTPSQAPVSEIEYLTRDEVEAGFIAQYRNQDSRLVPSSAPIPRKGSWIIDSHVGLHGREIEQVLQVAVEDIEVSEDTGPQKHADVERYARWLVQGLTPPPIRITQTDKGTLKTMDHRRLLAAKAAGHELIMARVSWSTDGNGNVVGLTHELALKGCVPIPLQSARDDYRLHANDRDALARIGARIGEYRREAFKTADERIEAEVRRVNALYPKASLSFGYIGNLSSDGRHDDRSWMVFSRIAERLPNGLDGDRLSFGRSDTLGIPALARDVVEKLESWVASKGVAKAERPPGDPQVGIGDRVRSYDFDHTDRCYCEGVIRGHETIEGCRRYVIDVDRVVWDDKEKAVGDTKVVYPPVNGVIKILSGTETRGVVLAPVEEEEDCMANVTYNLWAQDDVQFPRLITAIVATQGRIDFKALAHSMDINVEEVATLMGRAEEVWESLAGINELAPVDQFSARAEHHIEALRELVQGVLKDGGDIEADSQKIVLLNRLTALERAIHGTQAEDLTDAPRCVERMKG